MNKTQDKIAVFPGSFDPITCGHESVIKRAAPIFDKVIVAIGRNTLKNYLFSLEQRKAMIAATFADNPNIEVMDYDGLTVDFCKQMGAHYILRGLRTSADFEFERSIGQTNKQLYPDVETVFMLTQPEHTPLNSSIVRDVLKHGGDISRFVPKAAFEYIQSLSLT